MLEEALSAPNLWTASGRNTYFWVSTNAADLPRLAAGSWNWNGEPVAAQRLQPGKTYVLSFTVKRADGQSALFLGGEPMFLLTPGTYKREFKLADSTTPSRVAFQARTALNGKNVLSVSGISLVEKVVKAPRKGHYISFATSDVDRTEMVDLALEPGVQGVEMRYRWRDLETKEAGVVTYHFEQIASDLEALAAVDRRLIILLTDRTYDGTRATPVWFDAGANLNKYVIEVQGHDPTHVGYVSKRWDPLVVDAFNKLFAALAARFDTHPYFEGIAMQESALGNFVHPELFPDYSADAYAQALINIVGSAQVAFKHSTFFWYANFIRGGNSKLYTVADAIAPYNVGIGGPDVTPEEDGHIKIVTPFYQWAETTYPNLPKFCSMQRNSYRHLRPSGVFWTLGELFNFAKANYGCNYVFWNKKEGGTQRDVNGTLEYTTADALRIIQNNPVF